MAIWEYRTTELPTPHARIELFPDVCVFCKQQMRFFGATVFGDLNPFTGDMKRRLVVCSSCGWWVVSAANVESRPRGRHVVIRQAFGALRSLDITNVETPLAEVRQYLVARYQTRFDIHPARLEDIICAVFREHGYEVLATGGRGDDGIDLLVFTGQAADTIGVQVKRYRSKIEAEQIRSFAGALVLGGITSGIYVTTSEFTQGAQSTVKRLSERGLKVDLWNADRFYGQLLFTKRPPYRSASDDTAPYASAWRDPSSLPIVYERFANI